MNSLQEQISDQFEKQGLNGQFPHGPPVEAYSQIVNGKMTAIRLSGDTTEASTCIIVYTRFDRPPELVKSWICDRLAEQSR